MRKLTGCDPHGRTFETSPERQNGEVSIVPSKPKRPTILPFAETGTAPAINYAKLGVPANLPCSSGRGGARNSASRESDALTNAQIANLSSAERHAAAIGLPFNRMVTIHWNAAGVPLVGMAKATGRFLDLISKTIVRHDKRTAWLWVHENGDHKGWHCHLLVHVPADLVMRVAGLQKRWLRTITGKPYRASVICSKPIGGRLGLEVGNPELHAINLAVAFGYLCKGAPQSILDRHGIDRQHEAGGRIIGKRCGTSQNLSLKARLAAQRNALRLQ